MDGRCWCIAFKAARAVLLSQCCIWLLGCTLYRAIHWRLAKLGSARCIVCISRIGVFGSICGDIGGSIVETKYILILKGEHYESNGNQFSEISSGNQAVYYSNLSAYL